MSDNLAPTVLKIAWKTGLAGQYGYDVMVDYGAEQGGLSEVAFIGNDHSERVYMVTRDFQVPVDRSDLEGRRLTPDYIRRFFS